MFPSIAIYPPFTLSSLLPTCFPLVITILLSVSMSFCFFVLCLLNFFAFFHPVPLPPSLSAISVFSVSISILFVCLFCSLNCTYTWNHVCLHDVLMYVDCENTSHYRFSSASSLSPQPPFPQGERAAYWVTGENLSVGAADRDRVQVLGSHKQSSWPHRYCEAKQAGILLQKVHGTRPSVSKGSFFSIEQFQAL